MPCSQDVLNLGASLPHESRAGLSIVLQFHNQSAKLSQESQGHFVVQRLPFATPSLETYTGILQKFIPSGDFLDPTHSLFIMMNYSP